VERVHHQPSPPVPGPPKPPGTCSWGCDNAIRFVIRDGAGQYRATTCAELINEYRPAAWAPTGQANPPGHHAFAAPWERPLNTQHRPERLPNLNDEFSALTWVIEHEQFTRGQRSHSQSAQETTADSRHRTHLNRTAAGNLLSTHRCPDERNHSEFGNQGFLATALNQLSPGKGVPLDPWDRIRIDKRPGR
jgi:hypothetical protein